MLRLYDYLPSQNGYKIRMLLRHLGLAWETVPVAIFRGETRTPEFLAKNPAGAIPVLEPAPGQFIAESNAILCYLAEGTRFLPAERLARAQVMQWLFFEQYYVEPNLGTLRFWTLTGRLQANAALVPGKRAGAERALQALERHLARRAFLAADAYTIADIAVFAYTHLGEDAGFDFAQYPALRAWIARVKEAAGELPPVHPYSIDPDADLARG
jgi:glutathione S-transferase